MCPVSLMHVIFALGAFPILAHVPPSTFSCFKSGAPIRHLSKHVSKDCREAGPVLAPRSIAKMVSVPGTRLFELPAEDCFSHWFCLITWATALTTLMALLFAWLGFPCGFCTQWHSSTTAQVYCQGVLVGVSSLCPLTWH